MTEAQRSQAISRLIKAYTDETTVSQSSARAALIKEGIYTKKGRLRAEFGGSQPKDKAAA